MKTIVKLFIILSLFQCISCADNLPGMNENIKDATSTSGDMFFSNVLVNLAGQIGSTGYMANGTSASKLFVQLLTSVTYTEGVQYIRNFSWNPLYDMLRDLEEATKMVDLLTPQSAAAEIQKTNQLATLEVMKVYIYAILVESYGNVPYSEALDIDNVQPKYDDQQEIYLDLINKLSAAIANLNPAGTGFGAADLLYSGNVERWVQFANSVKLRMGMRIIDVVPATGEQVVAEAIAGGVFTSNSENALFRYLNDQNNGNPHWAFLVRQNLRYYVGTEPLVGYMLSVDDPRLDAYFFPATTGPNAGSHAGAISADVVPYDNYSILGARFRELTLPVIFMDYTSVEFFLAEAAERGIAGVTDAKDHYNKAITASFDYYGVDGADAYLAHPNVDYDTAEGTWRQKVGMQKWVSLFEQGFEAWTEYRRLDYPALQAPESAYSDVVPRRFQYPLSEQSVNGARYAEAVADMGGDEYHIRLFWDIY